MGPHLGPMAATVPHMYPARVHHQQDLFLQALIMLLRQGGTQGPGTAAAAVTAWLQAAGHPPHPHVCHGSRLPSPCLDASCANRPLTCCRTRTRLGSTSGSWQRPPRMRSPWNRAPQLPRQLRSATPCPAAARAPGACTLTPSAPPAEVLSRSAVWPFSSLPGLPAEVRWLPAGLRACAVVGRAQPCQAVD